MSAEREHKLLRELKERDEKIARLEQENTLLKQKVDLLVKRIFGASSEKLDARQLELLLEGSSPGKPCEPELAAEATRRSKEESTPSKSKPKGPRVPEHLPCVDEIIDPLPVQAEPGAWRYIGQETSEQLDYEPARFLRRRLIRRKYVKRGEVDAVPVIAPFRRCCRNAASRHPVSWRKSSWPATATTCLSIARSRFTRPATESSCPGKPWGAGRICALTRWA